MNIAVAGIGYVGLSNAVLLAQHNRIVAVDIQQERVKALWERCSLTADPEIEYLGKLFYLLAYHRREEF